ncbi:hypothetical protein CEXT_706801 [Caerostris extrusa]|uniref:Uncharacterized protein n=1 Tax=Caerostris extrusa TaxID=172846 RepID=A0AAV4PUZ6_CAEEX|nr:hypothetical protein CEXT_706801 [Caerostris extrusa]
MAPHFKNSRAISNTGWEGWCSTVAGRSSSTSLKVRKREDEGKGEEEEKTTKIPLDVVCISETRSGSGPFWLRPTITRWHTQGSLVHLGSSPFRKNVEGSEVNPCQPQAMTLTKHP